MTDFDDVDDVDELDAELADVLDDDLDEALGEDFDDEDPDLAGIDLATLGLEDIPDEDDEEDDEDDDESADDDEDQDEVDLETDDGIPGDDDVEDGLVVAPGGGDATALVEDDDLLDVVDDVPAPLERDLDVDDEVRDGEFVCRSCFMAKRESALADEEHQLCRDCV